MSDEAERQKSGKDSKDKRSKKTSQTEKYETEGVSGNKAKGKKRNVSGESGSGRAKSPKQRKLSIENTSEKTTDKITGAQEELLDYDDELGQSQESRKSDKSGVSSTSSRMTTRSRSLERGVNDDQGSNGANENGSASVLDDSNSTSSSEESDLEEAEVEKLKKKRKEKAKRAKATDEGTIVFTKEQLDEYMNKSIGSAVENALKAMEEKRRSEITNSEYEPNVADQMRNLLVNEEQPVEGSDSETTVYSQLIKPPGNLARSRPTVTFRSPLLSPEKEGINPDVMPEINLSDAELRRISDESNLDSSGELSGEINFVGRSLPLPPPGPEVGPSKDNNGQQKPVDERTRARQRADVLLRDAEINKATMAMPPGKSTMFNSIRNGLGFKQRAEELATRSLEENLDGSMDYLHDAVTDHVDKGTFEKIVRGEYVDLVKLLPRDIDAINEEDSLQLTNRDGRTFYVPPADRDPQSISNFRKWQLAFRVFQAVYVTAYPEKGLELLQYVHLIEDYCSTWIWDNVYKYDKRHRRLMEKFKNRFWHVPYDWGKKELKTTHAMVSARGSTNNSTSNKPGQSGGTSNGSKRVACKNFNRGHCKFGNACKFDHNRCAHCGKSRHLMSSCRKLKADLGERGDKSQPDSAVVNNN